MKQNRKRAGRVDGGMVGVLAAEDEPTQMGRDRGRTD